MNSKLMLAALAGALLVGGSTVGCADNAKAKESQKAEAVKHWNETRAGVLAQLAKSQYESGQYDKCRQTVNQALALNPTSAPLHILSAKLSIEQGSLDSAEKELAFARTLDEKNAEAEYLTGVVYQRWQKFEEAYDHYTKAADKDPTELAYVLARAETLVAMNRSAEALAQLEDKSSYFEHSAEVHHAIGQLLVDQGKYPEAVKALRQAMVLATDDMTIREHLAFACYYNKQYQPALEGFDRLLKDDANAKRVDLLLAQGECQMQLQRYREARNTFDSATQINPSSTAAWLSLAKAALQLNDSRRAELCLGRVMSIDSGSPEAHLMMGYCRLRENKLTDAMSEFQRASALDLTDTVSLCMIGYTLERCGKPQQAMKYYGQALKLNPKDDFASKLMASVDLEK